MPIPKRDANTMLTHDDISLVFFCVYRVGDACSQMDTLMEKNSFYALNVRVAHH